MTVTLALSPEEWTALSARATADKVDIETILHRLISGLIAQTMPDEISTLPVFLSSHIAADDPEEQAEREREAIEMQNNIRRWRAEQR